MTLLTMYRIEEVKKGIIRYSLLLPYMIITFVFSLVVVLAYKKYFPETKDEWTISFSSALFGALIGSITSFYIMSKSRKNDNIDKIILEKRDLIYRPLFCDCLSVKKLFSNNKLVDTSRLQIPSWHDISTTDLVILIPKKIKGWMMELVVKINDYKKQDDILNKKLPSIIDVFLIDNNEYQLYEQSLKTISGSLYRYIKCDTKTSANYLCSLSDRYGNIADTTIRDQLISKLHYKISLDSDYLELVKCCNRINDNVNQMYFLIEYILKYIVYRFYDDNYSL